MDQYPLARHFEEVSLKIKDYGKGKSMSDDELLNLYSLFKQATQGDNTTSQPWAVQFEARAKWNAWTAHKGKSREQAQHEYVQLALRYFPEDVAAKYQ